MLPAMLTIVAIALSAEVETPATAPRPASAPATWFTISDYPAEALAKHQEGAVGFKVEVDPSGRVTSCDVTATSGSASLDSGTCALLKTRATFEPARNAAGAAVSGTFESKVRWVYPAGAAPQLTSIELHETRRSGSGVSILLVDENGLVTNCSSADRPYWNVPSPPDFCGMFPRGSRYAAPATYKGKPVKRRIRLSMTVDDENLK